MRDEVPMWRQRREEEEKRGKGRGDGKMQHEGAGRKKKGRERLGCKTYFALFTKITTFLC